MEAKARVLAKREMRKDFRSRYAAISNRENLEKKIVGHLAEFLNNSDGIWGIYKPIAGEISLDRLPEQTTHIQWAYPRVSGEGLEFYIPGPMGFVDGYAGIAEPVVSGAQKVSLEDLTGILIPGLGFDRSGVRLGKGQGHYDRALSDFSGCKVGISFSDLVDESIPEDNWDVRMDYLATEVAVEAVN